MEPPPTVEPGSSVLAPTRRGVLGLLHRAYDWTLSWADTRWGPAALGALTFSEAVFFPVPPDPLLMALALGRPRRSFFFASLATAGSVLGGVCGYALGYWLWQSVDEFFFRYVPGFTPENFLYVQTKYNENAFLALFAAALTPIPYKVFTVASGVFEVSLSVLIGASVLGRGLRFFAVAGLMRWLGPPAKVFIDRHFNTLKIIFFILLVAGFLLIRQLF